MPSDTGSLLLLQAALDSVSAHIAILDSNGIIIRVNAAWIRYGQENNLKYANSGIGTESMGWTPPPESELMCHSGRAD